MDRVRVRTGLAVQDGGGAPHGLRHLSFVDPRRRSQSLHVLRRPGARQPPEHQEVRKRVASQAVGAVHPGGGLAGREQARQRRHLRVGIDPHAPHEIVQRRTDLHRLPSDVHLGQFLELMVHGWELPLDLTGRHPRRDVQEHAAVGRPPPLVDLADDGARHDVARQELGRPARRFVPGEPAVRLVLRRGGLRGEAFGNVAEHEAFLRAVQEDPAVAAHPLGHQDAAHRRRPDHPGRVKLGEFQVHQLGARLVGHRVAVAGVLP